MNREQFLKDRMTGIGGSDASAVIFGVSERGDTALDIYLEKRAEKPARAELAMRDDARFGLLLEPVLREEYARRHEVEVVKPVELRRHPKYPFIVGNPDGLVVGRGRGWEGKTARYDRGWGESGTDQVPRDYIIQVQHYMILEAVPVWDLSALIGGQDYREYTIEADRELQDMIIESEHAFWQRVQKGEPPDPDYTSANALSTIKRLYPGTSGETIDATPVHEEWRRIMEEASDREALMKGVRDGALARLAWDMGEAAKLKFADGKVLRRKLTKRKGSTIEAYEYMDIRITNDKE